MNKFTSENIETLEQIILARRDVRGNRFTDEPVVQADLDKILFAGVNAPSVGFSQPWEFVVIKDLNIRKEDVFISLVEVAKENWSFGNGEAQYAPK